MKESRKTLITLFVCLAYLADCIRRVPAMESPSFVLGFYIYGRIAYIGNALVFLLECYAILGLWRLRKIGWNAALAISLVSALNSMLEVSLPQGRAMIMQLGQEAGAMAFDAVHQATFKATIFSAAHGVLIFLLLVVRRYYRQDAAQS